MSIQSQNDTHALLKLQDVKWAQTIGMVVVRWTRSPVELSLLVHMDMCHI